MTQLEQCVSPNSEFKNGLSVTSSSSMRRLSFSRLSQTSEASDLWPEKLPVISQPDDNILVTSALLRHSTGRILLLLLPQWLQKANDSDCWLWNRKDSLLSANHTCTCGSVHVTVQKSKVNQLQGKMISAWPADPDGEPKQLHVYFLFLISSVQVLLSLPSFFCIFH